jgi:hypothetical protein
MRDDVNDEMSNGTPKILIPSNGVVNWDQMLKLRVGQKVTMLHIYEVG